MRGELSEQATETTEYSAFPENRETALFSATKGLLSATRTKKWPFCAVTWFLGCHANKGKMQFVFVFAGVANNGEEGGGKPSFGCGDFLVQCTDNKDFTFRDPNLWPGGVLAGAIKEAKWPWEPWLQPHTSSSAFVILGISKSPLAQ